MSYLEDVDSVENDGECARALLQDEEGDEDERGAVTSGLCEQ